MIQSGRFAPGAPPAALVQLDPALSGATVSFANGYKTVIASAYRETDGAKVNYARSAGKFYFEVVIDYRTSGTSANDNLASVGIGRIDSSYVGNAEYGTGAQVFVSGSGNGRFWIDGEIAADFGQAASGDRYSFAVDITAGLIWLKRNTGNWNGSGTANPATGVGGFSIRDLIGYDVAPLSTTHFPGDQHTYRFLTSEFTGPVPSGFLEWPTDTSGQNDGRGNTQFNSLRNTNVTLSAGNLTAARTGTNAVARSRDYKATGKFYMEFTVGTWNGTGDSVGLCNPGATSANIVTGGTAGIFAYRSGAVWQAGGNTGIALGAVANGDRIDMAVDLDNKLAWFRRNGGNWNNSGTANPATGVGGRALSYSTLAPCMGFGDGGSNGSTATANSGDTSFVGAVPAGFVSGWPTKQTSVAPAAKVKSLWVGEIA